MQVLVSARSSCSSRRSQRPGAAAHARAGAIELAAEAALRRERRRRVHQLRGPAERDPEAGSVEIPMLRNSSGVKKVSPEGVQCITQGRQRAPDRAAIGAQAHGAARRFR